MKEKTKYELRLYAVIFLFIGIGYFILFSSSLHITGYHNMDLAFNMKFLNAEYDLNLVDETTHGIKDSSELWHIGLQQINKAFYNIFGIGIIFGMIINISIEPLMKKVYNLKMENKKIKNDKLSKTKR